jgi:hypothetical protein
MEGHHPNEFTFDKYPTPPKGATISGIEKKSIFYGREKRETYGLS